MRILLTTDMIWPSVHCTYCVLHHCRMCVLLLPFLLVKTLTVLFSLMKEAALRGNKLTSSDHVQFLISLYVASCTSCTCSLLLSSRLWFMREFPNGYNYTHYKLQAHRKPLLFLKIKFPTHTLKPRWHSISHSLNEIINPSISQQVNQYQGKEKF